MEEENCTKGVEITKGRATGNTTRIVDNAIQMLFKGYECILSRNLGREPFYLEIISRVKNRLENEHGINFFEDVLIIETPIIVKISLKPDYLKTLRKFDKGLLVVEQSRQNTLVLNKELEAGDVLSYEPKYECKVEVIKVIKIAEHFETEVVFEKGNNVPIPDKHLIPGASWIKLYQKIKA